MTAAVKNNLLIAGAAAGVLYCIHRKKSGVHGIGAMYYDLRSEHGRRAMYYGKATVIDDNGKLQLKSYDTIVAEYNKRTKTLTIYGWYSMTTSRHIREFARQLGIELPSGTDIAGKYKA